LKLFGGITAKIYARVNVGYQEDLFSHYSEIEMLKEIGNKFDVILQANGFLFNRL
jgi:hypothetical protein